MNSGKKILILGGNSFVGRFLQKNLVQNHNVFFSSRMQPQEIQQVWFDYRDQASWERVLDIQPEVIINCIGYGVLSRERDAMITLETNYLLARQFLEFLASRDFQGHYIHIGSSFEYDLDACSLHEHSPELPKSVYGISKLMATRFLLDRKPFSATTVLRPFNLFGPGEDDSRLIPSLVKAQIQGTSVELTSGVQQRDFVYVGDFTQFLMQLISYSGAKIPELINVGSGDVFSIRVIGEKVGIVLARHNLFRPELWKWGALSQRATETSLFYNASAVARSLGFHARSMDEAIEETTIHFLKKYGEARHGNSR